jgi:carboxypeptidase Taq
MAICKEVISFIGFDWQRGRLDTSEHPFSIGLHPTDIRITVRHSSPNLLDQIMSGLHEAGHGLYEMGLPRQWYGTPLAEAISCSIHESQSLLWENIIGRSRAFVSHLFSILRAHYPTTCPFTSKEALYQQLNRVECSLIRTQADEVTYPLHIIMRFEIEKELLTGALSVHDLPQRWSEGMQTMLGCQPPSDKLGCLQDVHWSLGSFGYFPTYTLGSLYAVSFFEAMKQALPNLESLVSQGELAPIRSWLHEHVWSQGRRFLSHELVTRALGREPSEDDYINYLRAKYCS